MTPEEWDFFPFAQAREVQSSGDYSAILGWQRLFQKKQGDHIITLSVLDGVFLLVIQIDAKLFWELTLQIAYIATGQGGNSCGCEWDAPLNVRLP
jgi:hypothetical protein